MGCFRLPRYLLLAFCLAGISACANTGAKFQPVKPLAGKGVLHVYFPSWSSLNVPNGYDIRVDGKSVGGLRPNTYVTAQLKPGRHLIQVVQKTSIVSQLLGGSKASVTIDAGGERYARVVHVGAGRTTVTVIGNAAGRAEARRTRASN